MVEQCRFLKAVVLDWAGTTVDHGSRAPAIVFKEIFRQRGIDITTAQAREPMGRAKREHIAAIAAMPAVSTAWITKFGAACDDAAIDEMYADFLPLQKETLKAHCHMIPGVVEAIEQCRAMGLKIGSSTGYTHELMEAVARSAAEQGYVPDCLICAEDVPRGRPAPYQLFEAAKQMDVYPMQYIVKIDDTPVGVQAGRNAGCWSVGVTRTGNCVGRSIDEIAALSTDELAQICNTAADQLKVAGAHAILQTVADLPELVKEIDARIGRGENCLTVASSQKT